MFIPEDPVYNLFIAYMLWFISGFGALGFHRFYLGKIPTGILWMCTGGLGMFGAVYDFFTLPRQVAEANLREEIRNAVREPHNHTRLNNNWRYAEDAQARVLSTESTERTILRLAKQNKGIVSASELALEAGISIEEAKKALEKLVDQGHAELRVRKSGTLVYTFPEFMDTDSPLEDF
ncbi:NINE protein [Gracilinema caldarium]|uniref:NINE protein n=1 Tax=Gracilinema caldarium TaxID=215591 RepID=UPI0026EA6F8F|nr:NINE protein [Gracilinema caldarium]